MGNTRFIIGGTTERVFDNDALEALIKFDEVDTTRAQIIYDGHNLIAITEGRSTSVEAYFARLFEHANLRSVRILHRAVIEKLELRQSSISRLDLSSRETVDQSYLGHLIKAISQDDRGSLDTLMAVLNRFLINNQ